MLSETNIDPKWMYVMVFFIILIGLNSAVNTGQWIFKALQENERRNRLNYRVTYNDVSNVNDSNLALNRFEEHPCI